MKIQLRNEDGILWEFVERIAGDHRGNHRVRIAFGPNIELTLHTSEEMTFEDFVDKTFTLQLDENPVLPGVD